MNLKNCILHLTALALLPVGLANGETIASTTFDEQVINGTTDSSLAPPIIGVEGFDYSDRSIADAVSGTFWDWDNKTKTHTSTGIPPAVAEVLEKSFSFSESSSQKPQ